jgi:hypothetical protein
MSFHLPFTSKIGRNASIVIYATYDNGSFTKKESFFINTTKDLSGLKNPGKGYLSIYAEDTAI